MYVKTLWTQNSIERESTCGGWIILQFFFSAIIVHTNLKQSGSRFNSSKKAQKFNVPIGRVKSYRTRRGRERERELTLSSSWKERWTSNLRSTALKLLDQRFTILVILLNLLLSNNCWSYTNSSSGNNFNPDKFFTSPHLHHKPQGFYIKRAARLPCFWSLCNMKLEPYGRILASH